MAYELQVAFKAVLKYNGDTKNIQGSCSIIITF